jgi:hypothetical protein
MERYYNCTLWRGSTHNRWSNTTLWWGSTTAHRVEGTLSSGEVVRPIVSQTFRVETSGRRKMDWFCHLAMSTSGGGVKSQWFNQHETELCSYSTLRYGNETTEPTEPTETSSIPPKLIYLCYNTRTTLDRTKLVLSCPSCFSWSPSLVPWEWIHVLIFERKRRTTGEFCQFLLSYLNNIMFNGIYWHRYVSTFHYYNLLFIMISPWKRPRPPYVRRALRPRPPYVRRALRPGMANFSSMLTLCLTFHRPLSYSLFQILK